MAKKKISDLPAGSALTGVELLPIVQSGTTKRITAQDIANLGNASGVEGSGTIDYLSKFTASSTIGNSQFFDNGTSIGLGTATPNASYKLDIVGNLRATTIVKLGGTSAEYLKADGSVSTLTNPVTGTGTTNYLPKFTTTTTIGNSRIFDNGTSVGIGTATPSASALLEVATTGGTTSTILISGTTGQAQLKLLAGSGASNRATRIDLFNGVASTTIARWTLINDFNQDGTNDFRFVSASATALTLTQAGNLGLGITPTTNTGAKYIQFGAGAAFTTNSTNNSNFWHNTTFDASGNTLYAVTGQQSSYYRQINGQHAWAYAAAGTAGNAITFTNNMVLDTAGSLQLLGGLALSGGTAPASGIQFPATQVASANANNLDDYEEGTWTMGVSFGGGTTGITYSSNTGQYTKVGRKVTVTGYILLTNKGTSTGNASITGLPFTSGSAVSFFGVPSLFLTSTTFTNQYTGLLLNSSTSFNINQVTNLGVATNLTNVNFANNSEIIVTLTYFV